MNAKMSIGNTTSYPKSWVLNAMPIHDIGVHVPFEEPEVGVTDVQFWVDHTIDYAVSFDVVNLNLHLDR